ncbi:MAG TPA: DUF5990 family protein [Caulobacteraceae bacterium]|nr:DUF5990 family protein [Caulobacteraceae bacterium]
MPTGQTITLRLTIPDPLPGVTYSLQDKKSGPVGPVVADHGPLSFDVAVRVAPGPRFLGEFVRSEGPQRRFVYIAVGLQAGDAASDWNRRVKIDIHDLPPDLLARALDGRILEARLPGRDRSGAPACATQKPIGGWTLAAD